MELGGRDLKKALQLSRKVRFTTAKQSDKKETFGNRNPLEIPEIVAIVTGHISHVEDLKCVRGLNKMWKDEVFQKWRNTAVFLINYKTIPILLEAFGGSEDLSEVTEAQKAEALARKDPFRLQQFPFKKYRFSKSQSWMYPFDDEIEGDSERKLIWEKCINPNATYLDVGECILLSWQRGIFSSQSCLPGLRWIFCHASNVTDFAMAPLVMNETRFVDPNTDRFLGSLQQEPPIWFQSIFEAPRVATLTISSPQEKPCFISLGELLHREVMASLFCMLPNLKTLNLLNDNEDRVAIINGLRNSTVREERFRLQSLNAPLCSENGTEWGRSLEDYFRDSSKCKNPSLRELKLALLFEAGVQDYYQGSVVAVIWPPFYFVCGTLTKLEFQVDCDEYPDEEIPEKPSFFFGDCIFPNLTHFKVQLHYSTFYGNLLTFDLSNLKNMPLLQEFHFGSSGCVEKGWVTRKLGPVENNAKAGKWTIDGYEMPHLKSLHFHGNFKKEALQQLGKIMGNLKTLELVLDEENCLVVKDIWPRLQNLNLLPCSDVPGDIIYNPKDSFIFLNVVDESNDWFPARAVPLED